MLAMPAPHVEAEARHEGEEARSGRADAARARQLHARAP